MSKENYTRPLATKLRGLRASRGLSLRQAEELTGVSASTLSRYERGIGYPDTIILCMLGEKYQVSIDELIDTYEPTPEETDAFLIDHGYNLEQLRLEINDLIDRVKAEAVAVLKSKQEPTP